jgi:class 3 adenylate cyclase/tetratricopeptide (TPR) repeat protein
LIPPVDRRQLSIFFFDLVNAAGLSERLDPEDLRDVLRTLLDACESSVLRHGGHVVQRLGDALLIYFGYPLVLEDDARRAVQAGLESLREVRKRAEDLSPKLGTVVQARVGIHTGPVVLENVGTEDRPLVLAIGETPNKAARVQAAAKPDTIAVSDATYRLTRGYFTFTDRGLESLKGFSEPTRLYTVEEETGVRSRLDATDANNLTPFVDRHEPLAFLKDRWEEAKRGGPSFVLVSGDAGIGKSRLVHVLRQHVTIDRTLFISCFCSSFFQSTALWPIVDMLNRRFSFNRRGDPKRQLEGLRGELESLGLATPEALSLLTSLLGLPATDVVASPTMTAQRERRETFQVLLRWLGRLTANQPVLLLVEDLHWIDPSTLEFLSLVAQQAPAAPLMVVLTHRPEFVSPWEGPRISRLPLGRLDRQHAEEILKSVAGEDALSGDVVDKLLTRADGVPLFLEEITKAVVEWSGLDSRSPGARGPAIPATLQDSLAARLDRLGPGKPVAQLAATLGRTFEFELLKAVSGMEEDLLRAELERLMSAELLHRHGTPPKETYIFKHALIQDAAYASLLRRTRQQYHLKIVATLTERFPETVEARPELLAHHCSGAGLSREAIDHWIVAGQRAMARSAFSEAIDLFSQALKELPTLLSPSERDKTEIELRSGLGLALISTRGWAVPEVEENYTRARRLCESFGSVPVQVLYGIWGVHLVRADQEAVTSVASMFRDLLARTEDLRTQVAARSVLGAFAFYSGRYPDAAREFREARALVHRSKEISSSFQGASQDYGLDAYLYSELYLTHCLQNMGSLVEAETLWRETLSWIELTLHPFKIATVLAYGVTLTQGAHDVEQTAAISGRLAQLSAENGFHHWLAIARCGSGWATAQNSEGREGISELEQGLATLRYLGAFLVFPHYASYLVEAYLLRGDLERANQVADDALAVVEQRLGHNHEPWLFLLKSEILIRSGDEQAAMPLLRKAIALALAGGHRLIASDAAHLLGRTLRDRGPVHEVAADLRSALQGAADGGGHRRFGAARDWLARASAGPAG